MAFWGCSFSFNGIPCEDFDLMIYNIDNATHSTGKFSTGVSIIEDTVSMRWKPYFYGTQMKEKLVFSIVFGVNKKRIEQRKYLERYELEEIASWLTGHQKYMWLEIHQEDMEYVRYRCIVTALEIVEIEMMPTALKATFTCDSPYAYMYPHIYEYKVENELTIDFFNESSHNGYYNPVVEIDLDSSKSFSIRNETDNSYETIFSDIPNGITKIIIDNENCILTTNDPSLNLYPHFNFKFIRLLRGMNRIKFTGNGTVRFICEFPINIGG